MPGTPNNSVATHRSLAADWANSSRWEKAGDWTVKRIQVPAETREKWQRDHTWGERRDTHATSLTGILRKISTHLTSVLMPGKEKVRRIFKLGTSKRRDTKECHTCSSAISQADRQKVPGGRKLQLPEVPKKLRRTRVQILQQENVF